MEVTNGYRWKALQCSIRSLGGSIAAAALRLGRRNEEPQFSPGIGTELRTFRGREVEKQAITDHHRGEKVGSIKYHASGSKMELPG